MSREASLHFQRHFDPTELADRRRRAVAARGGGLAVVAGGSDIQGFAPVAQSNDFHYRIGVEVPHRYLTMDAATGRGALHLPPRDARHGASDGPALSDEDGPFALARTGIDEVRPMEPGRVFALDPELFISEEQLYIRVEDTVLVTNTGVENLTAACPRGSDAVERPTAKPCERRAVGLDLLCCGAMRGYSRAG